MKNKKKKNIEMETGLYEEDEDIIVYNSPFVSLNKEQLSHLNLNFSASDIFVERPYSRKYRQENLHTFSKQNYMINRLKHSPTLPQMYCMAKYLKVQRYKIVNIFDYIHTIGYLISKFKDYKNSKDNVQINLLYTYIYKFFTNVYITTTPVDNMYYIIKNNQIYFRFIQKLSNISSLNITKLRSSQRYMNEWQKKTKDYIWFLI